ncbi:MAG: hypothetical protein LBF85_05265, partial [Tannerella sp.]|nr:hypothetical protein [Tannerella sp.]
NLRVLRVSFLYCMRDDPVTGSVATWQSRHTHCPGFVRLLECFVPRNDATEACNDAAERSVMTADAIADKRYPRHCEERSDVAIQYRPRTRTASPAGSQ